MVARVPDRSEGDLCVGRTRRHSRLRFLTKTKRSRCRQRPMPGRLAVRHRGTRTPDGHENRIGGVVENQGIQRAHGQIRSRNRSRWWLRSRSGRLYYDRGWCGEHGNGRTRSCGSLCGWVWGVWRGGLAMRAAPQQILHRVVAPPTMAFRYRLQQSSIRIAIIASLSTAVRGLGRSIVWSRGRRRRRRRIWSGGRPFTTLLRCLIGSTTADRRRQRWSLRSIVQKGHRVQQCVVQIRGLNGAIGEARVAVDFFRDSWKERPHRAVEVGAGRSAGLMRPIWGLVSIERDAGVDHRNGRQIRRELHERRGPRPHGALGGRIHFLQESCGPIGSRDDSAIS